MKPKTKIFLIGGLLFFTMFAIIVGSIAFVLFVYIPMKAKQGGELDKKRSAETAGKITSVRTTHKGMKADMSYYKYQYVVNGTSYDAEETWGAAASDDDKKKEGLSVKVCYNPSNPQDSRFHYLDENYVCGQ